MAFLDNPRTNHHIHLASLGSLFLCGLLTMTTSAGFLDEAKAYTYGGRYNRYHLDANRLLVAAGVLMIVGTVMFFAFNTVGSLFKGKKNSLIVEIVVFGVLLTLNLAGVARLSTNEYGLHCSQKICNFGKAALAFAWISTILLVAFLTFLLVWSFVNKRGQGEASIYKSNIKAHYVGGGIRLPAEAVMTNIAPTASPVSTSHPASPVVVAAPSTVTSHPCTPVASASPSTPIPRPNTPVVEADLPLPVNRGTCSTCNSSLAL